MNYKDVMAKLDLKYPKGSVSEEMRKYRFN